jgi:hypothetical protein
MRASVGRLFAVSLVSVVMLGVSPSTARAQSVFGVKGGVQWTTLRIGGQTAPDQVRRPGFIAGILYGFGQGVVTGQIEGLVSRHELRQQAGNVTLDSTITYWEIPALVRVNVARFPSGRVYVAAGAALASRWQASTEIGGTSVDNKAGINAYDGQWIVAGGVEVHRVLIDVRLTRGLRNIDATLPAGADKITTDSIAMTVGKKF